MDFAKSRERLISHIEPEIRDKRVLDAMSRVPREKFVSPDLQHSAYEDRPLPIGLGQTISQPLIVAMMTEALELTGKEKVLEIGTGSGYQTAILAELADTVISVERLPELDEAAKNLLNELGYTNITVQIAEKTLGWAKEAPYDAIITTAGAPKVPPGLVAQLKYNGIMVIPVGSRHLQELYKVTRLKTKNRIQNLGGCRFVSLIGKGAWDE
ncbi:MAG: protein-L-isoaspartate(D-aspartate) O-methyltransferase [Dehalococcoidales bacterium]|nr:MAG: protein-L-isoaspartate(D-aspartate) O-methyltransferase [Dehalococcoidales bacterium]